MSVRPAELKDCLSILDWRNDSLTRSMSRNEALIDTDSHVVWYGSVLKNMDKCLLIGEILNVPYGMVRFDRILPAQNWEVSITLAPDYRGKGLSKQLLSSAIIFFYCKFPETVIFADIKPENVTSRNLFEASGFKYYSRDEHMLRFLYQPHITKDRDFNECK